MLAVTLIGRRAVRVADMPAPEILAETDAVVRVALAGVCGSDLWD